MPHPRANLGCSIDCKVQSARAAKNRQRAVGRVLGIRRRLWASLHATTTPALNVDFASVEQVLKRHQHLTGFAVRVDDFLAIGGHLESVHRVQPEVFQNGTTLDALTTPQSLKEPCAW